MRIGQDLDWGFDGRVISEAFVEGLAEQMGDLVLSWGVADPATVPGDLDVLWMLVAREEPANTSSPELVEFIVLSDAPHWGPCVPVHPVEEVPGVDRQFSSPFGDVVWELEAQLVSTPECYAGYRVLYRFSGTRTTFIGLEDEDEYLGLNQDGLMDEASMAATEAGVVLERSDEAPDDEITIPEVDRYTMVSGVDLSLSGLLSGVFASDRGRLVVSWSRTVDQSWYNSSVCDDTDVFRHSAPLPVTVVFSYESMVPAAESGTVAIWEGPADNLLCAQFRSVADVMWDFGVDDVVASRLVHDGSTPSLASVLQWFYVAMEAADLAFIDSYCACGGA